jgi:hypothetical protein
MLNMDFAQRLVIDTANMDWQASPMPGVKRKRMAYEEVERGHATSIVEFEPGSRFSPHGHPQGEEILVLQGTFSDEYGDYPAGSYFRNPEGFTHAPFSKEGCVILVKLHQFRKSDTRQVRVDTRGATFTSSSNGIGILPLHMFEGEITELQKWPQGTSMEIPARARGLEIYVISGLFTDQLGSYPQGFWIRDGHPRPRFAKAEQETLMFVKTGHLPLQEKTLPVDETV